MTLFKNIKKFISCVFLLDKESQEKSLRYRYPQVYLVPDICKMLNKRYEETNGYEKTKLREAKLMAMQPYTESRRDTRMVELVSEVIKECYTANRNAMMPTLKAILGDMKAIDSRMQRIEQAVCTTISSEKETENPNLSVSEMQNKIVKLEDDILALEDEVQTLKDALDKCNAFCERISSKMEYSDIN